MLDDMQDFKRRLERTVLAKFGGDRIKALNYLNRQGMFYARKADRMRGTPTHAHWSKVFEAYNSVQYTIDYYLCLEQDANEEWDQEMADIHDPILEKFH